MLWLSGHRDEGLRRAVVLAQQSHLSAVVESFLSANGVPKVAFFFGGGGDGVNVQAGLALQLSVGNSSA